MSVSSSASVSKASALRTTRSASFPTSSVPRSPSQWTVLAPEKGEGRAPRISPAVACVARSSPLARLPH
jgi:hypothetical protein